jgi:PEP-CTERM motif
MRKLLLATTALLALSGVPASAYTIQIYGSFDRTISPSDPAGVSAQSFAGSGSNQQINSFGANAENGYTSVDGTGARSGLFIGNVPINVVNEEASPFGNLNDSRVYLAAGGGGGLLTLNSLTGDHNSLTMLWGTVDSGQFRNRITLFDGLVATGDVITGDSVFAQCAAQSIACGEGDHNVWLKISGLADFDVAKFSDRDANSFEFAPAVAPVPEPATWAMMLLGLAGVGLMGLRKRRNAVPFRIA